MKLYNYLIIVIIILSLNLNLVNAQEKSCIYFFYGNGCQHCAKVEPIIKNLEIKYNSSLKVQYYEIYNNRSNMLLLNQYFDAYNVSQSERGIPAVFISNKYLIGDNLIIEQIELFINSNDSKTCPSLKTISVTRISEDTPPVQKLGTISILTVIGAAIVDSINPCAIAVLLILLGALIVSNEKIRALKAGFAFIISIYISYFLFGLGLFSALQISGLSYWFYKIIGVLAIIIGLANIKDFFWYGGVGFAMEIPKKWRPTLKKMLGTVTSPLGAFLMGFIVCLFELPCTGGPYIFILGLLAEKTTMMYSIPILLLYNLFFVLPLIVITIGIFFKFASIEKATKWKDKNIRLSHLVTGIIMLILGILVFFGIV